jgi:hypothetical protein
MSHPTGRFACALLVSLTFAAPRLAAAAPCDQLSTLNLGEGVSIASAVSVASGSFTPPGGRGGREA